MKENISKITIAVFLIVGGLLISPLKSQAQGLQYATAMFMSADGCVNILCLNSEGNECNSPGSKFKICDQQ